MKESTLPPTAAILDTTSSPLTPAAKRVRMSSASFHQASTDGEATPAQPHNAGTNELQTELLTADGDLEVVSVFARAFAIHHSFLRTETNECYTGRYIYRLRFRDGQHRHYLSCIFHLLWIYGKRKTIPDSSRRRVLGTK